MIKNRFVPLNTQTSMMITSLLCLLALNSCGKDGQVSSRFLNTATAQGNLNPLSKGEQLNPGSKGERIISGELSLLGANPLIPAYAVHFFLDDKPVPTEWISLNNTSKQTLHYQITNMPIEHIHLLEVRYAGESLSTMVPPNTKAEPRILDLTLRSSLVVNTVRFADARAILRLSDWTPEQLQKLINHKDIDTLMDLFKTENREQTPTKLSQWSDTNEVQQQLQIILNSLN